jgi:uncharacterized membrane protein YdjX (TVP38/TMEM64 family)
MKWAASIIIVIALLAAAQALELQELMKSFLAWTLKADFWGRAGFIGLYVLASLLFLPGWVLTLGAGAVYGVIQGSAVVSIGSTLGATFAFLAGRHLVRPWVEKKMESYPQFKALDEAVAKEGWKIVGLTRLSPVFPFNLLNYFYGVTKVKLWEYVLSSWIGMMPGTIAYVYIGSLATDLAAIASKPVTHEANSVQWAMRLLGLAATLAVTVYAARIARLALKSKIEGD